MMKQLDDLLRSRGAFEPGSFAPLSYLVTVVVAGGFIYGLFMGSFSFVQQFFGITAIDPSLRWLQGLFSALKVPILVVISTLICLPNFIAVNTVLGLGPDLRASIRAILIAQGCVAVCLASLAPVILTVYLASRNYPTASIANGAIFLFATLGGQLVLTRQYRPLLRKNSRHRWALMGWLGLYMFVAIQLAWMLRPFIGAPSIPISFLRAEQWGSCYLKLWEAISRFLLER